MDILVPPRQRGIEFIDDPAIDSALVRRSMRDIVCSNRLLGGKRAALAELRPVLAGLEGRNTGTEATLLDVGTGGGDIARAAREMARAQGVHLTTVGVDMSESLLCAGHAGNDVGVCGTALRLPFGDATVDIVLASQLVHHFADDDAVIAIGEMHRVARQAVAISDLRRSRVAAGGFWISSFPLGFHPVSRHDGVVSVMRGFLPAELQSLVESATGCRPVVNRRIGFRLTASWRTA